MTTTTMTTSTALAAAPTAGGLDIELLQGALSRALSAVSRALGDEEPTILFNAGAGQLRLAATNGVWAILYQLGAHIEAEGTVCLDGKLVTDLVTKLPSEMVHLQTDEVSLATTLRCGRIESQFAGMDPELFAAIPDLDALTSAPLCAIDAPTLRPILEHVADAAAKPDAGTALTGVLLQTQGTRLSVVATNSFRLCLHRELLAEATVDTEVLVPAQALRELSRILKDADPDDVVEVSLLNSGAQILFRVGPAALCACTLAAQFPKYAQILETAGGSSRCTIATSEILVAARRAALFAERGSLVIEMQPADGVRPGHLTLRARPKHGAGTGHVEVMDACIEGEGGAVTLNATLLQATIDAFKGDTLVIDIGGPAAPAVFRRAQDTLDVGSSALLMPMA